MAGKFTTITRDKGFKKAMETFRVVAEKPYVQVGVMESAGEHKGPDNEESLTVVEVATFHEFGTETVPERSFIRSTVDENFDSYVEKTKILQEKVILQAFDVKKALSVLGELIQSDIVKKIDSGIDPELADSTKKSKIVNGKSGNTPLVDTGQLKKSVRYKVVGT